MTDEIILMPISAECGSFLGCCIAGAALALAFSLMNAIEKAFCFTGIFAAILDFFFCLFCGFSVFSLLLRYCSGNIRGYLLLGTALGAIAFAFSLGEYVTDAFSALIKTAIKGIAELFRLLFLPILHIKAPICEAARKFSQHLRKFAKKVCQNRKFCLKNQSKS